MTHMSLVCTLNGQCSWICGEASCPINTSDPIADPTQVLKRWTKRTEGMDILIINDDDTFNKKIILTTKDFSKAEAENKTTIIIR